MQSTLAEVAPEIGQAPTTAELPAERPVALRRAPETLHPALWLGHQLGRQADTAVSSCYPALDAELPGGGWPRRCLTEVLVPHPGVGELRLIAPALTRSQSRAVMLFDPPMQLEAEPLTRLGFDLDQLIVVKTKSRTLPGTDSLWSLEQALKSGHVGAVVAWMPPRLRAEGVRRLQLASHNHDGVAFVFREMAVADRPSASPLRLRLRAGGVDRVRVDVLKRRGPPLLEPVMVDLPTVWSAAAKRRSAATVRSVERTAHAVQTG